MAKKKNAPTVKEPVVEQEVVEVVEQPTIDIIEEPKKPKRIEPKSKKLNDGWEIKTRQYFLKGQGKPLSYILKSADVYWFDEEKGYERELKYCSNQRTQFVDEMVGDQRMEHIVFRAGVLAVPKEKVILQKFLDLHPHKDKLFYEWKPEVKAANEIDWLEMEIDALNAAQNIDIDLAEAVMRVEVGSNVSKMSSKELRRDLLLYAKKNPRLFLELVEDDNVQLRNFGIKATELNIIKLSQDQRHFMWGSNDRKLMTVPFDEHPYTALAHWFKTDEGMEVYTNIEKRLS